MVAAAEDAVLAALEDEELLRATRDGRAVVTENARDFDRIVRDWSGRGEHHGGVVCTSPRRYHRGSKPYPASLVRALAALVSEQPASEKDWVHWLG